MKNHSSRVVKWGRGYDGHRFGQAGPQEAVRRHSHRGSLQPGDADGGCGHPAVPATHTQSCQLGRCAQRPRASHRSAAASWTRRRTARRHPRHRRLCAQGPCLTFVQCFHHNYSIGSFGLKSSNHMNATATGVSGLNSPGSRVAAATYEWDALTKVGTVTDNFFFCEHVQQDLSSWFSRPGLGHGVDRLCLTPKLVLARADTVVCLTSCLAIGQGCSHHRRPTRAPYRGVAGHVIPAVMAEPACVEGFPCALLAPQRHPNCD